jgi:hypothetical protein
MLTDPSIQNLGEKEISLFRKESYAILSSVVSDESAMSLTVKEFQ